MLILETPRILVLENVQRLLKKESQKNLLNINALNVERSLRGVLVLEEQKLIALINAERLEMVNFLGEKIIQNGKAAFLIDQLGSEEYAEIM